MKGTWAAGGDSAVSCSEVLAPECREHRVTLGASPPAGSCGSIFCLGRFQTCSSISSPLAENGLITVTAGRVAGAHPWEMKSRVPKPTKYLGQI